MWQDIFPEKSAECGTWLYVKHPQVIAVAVAVQTSISGLVAGQTGVVGGIPFRLAMAIYDHELWQRIEVRFPEAEPQLFRA